MHLLVGSWKLTNSLVHKSFRFFLFSIFNITFSKQQENRASVFFSETENFEFLPTIFMSLSFDRIQVHCLKHCLFSCLIILHLVLNLSLDQHEERILPDFKIDSNSFLKTVQSWLVIFLFVPDHGQNDGSFLIPWIHFQHLADSHTGVKLIADWEFSLCQEKISRHKTWNLSRDTFQQFDSLTYWTRRVGVLSPLHHLLCRHRFQVQFCNWKQEIWVQFWVIGESWTQCFAICDLHFQSSIQNTIEFCQTTVCLVRLLYSQKSLQVSDHWGSAHSLLHNIHELDLVFSIIDIVLQKFAFNHTSDWV